MSSDKIIDGKQLAESVRNRIKCDIEEIRAKHGDIHSNFTPGLAIVQVRDIIFIIVQLIFY